MKKVLRNAILSVLFLFCASAIAEDNMPKVRAFSLVVREGFGLIAVGDLNTTLGSINSMYDSVSEYYDRFIGKIRKVPCSSFDWEAELQWTVDRFSVGIALSTPTHYDRKSNLTYIIIGDMGTQTNDYTYEPDIRASAPIKLNLYYSRPLSQKLNLLYHGGLGYYRARMTLYEQSHLLTVDGATYVLDRLINVSGNNIGFHIGMGLEYKLNHSFSLFFDGQWRLCRIRSLQGDELFTANIYDAEGNLEVSESFSEEGYLYHFIEFREDFGFRCEALSVFDEIPEIWISPPTDIRKAFIDLSGFTFRIGLKIGLF